MCVCHDRIDSYDKSLEKIGSIYVLKRIYGPITYDLHILRKGSRKSRAKV